MLTRLEEDEIVVAAHKELGNKWTEIARRLKGRTDNQVNKPEARASFRRRDWGLPVSVSVPLLLLGGGTRGVEVAVQGSIA